jgi:hypothetical protein
MQVTLCAILCLTLGLSALVSRNRGNLPFAGARNFGQWRVELPRGWVIPRRTVLPLIVEAKEPAAEHEGRTILVRTEQKNPGLSPEEYLDNSGLLQGAVEAVGESDPISIPVAGTTGVLMQRQRAMQMDADLPAGYQPVWFAAGVLPNGRAISIELDCPDEMDPIADKMLIEKTAASLHFVDNP